MRIHSGEAKGRKLKTPDGKGTRPTDARARETLFNILSSRIFDIRVLDLYAGTGAVGLEALSRGAGSCLFVEQNAGAVRSIRENIRTFDWRDRANVWQSNVRSALRKLGDDGEEFGLVFADPPFTRGEAELRDLVAGLDIYSQLLHNEGKRFAPYMVIQHHWKARLPLPARYVLVQERRAGESVLSFLERVSEDQKSEKIATTDSP